METVIAMRGVARSFADKRALDGLDLEVQRGTLLALLGPNGAGKTTTMKLALGLLAPDAGSIEVLGFRPWTMPRAERKRIGYVSEQDFPFPALDFVAASRFLSSFYPRWDAAWLDELARKLGVPRGAPYSQLSRGEQRSFHLALTLAPRPELLLLDDPAQGLDVMTRREFMLSVLPLLHESRSTVVFSTHVLSDVERIASRVAILRAGKIVVHDELDVLKTRVRQVVVRESVPQSPRGTLRWNRVGREIACTVLDADPRELEALRASGNLIEERVLPFEDVFIALASERPALEPSHV